MSLIRLAALSAASALVLTACSEPASQPPPSAEVPPAEPTADQPIPPVVTEVPASETPVDPVETPPTEGEQGGTDSWRAVASTEDADRLARLPQAWRQALREGDAEHGAMIDSQGMALVPGAALAGALQPPPGAYRCRTFKLGSRDGQGLAYVDYPWFRCTIELTPGGDLILTKTTGSQRARGLLYPDTDTRLVYIGAQAWGADEKGYPAYGQMPERDQIGVLERIGENRWRLVLPWPKQESKLEVLELRR